MHTRFFIDMDGVLAEWETSADYTQKGYYATRPPIQNMVNAVKQMILQKKEVYILSAVLQDDHSASDKHVWLCNMFGNLLPMERRIFVPYGACKADYVRKLGTGRNVLIDDYNLNLTSWNGVPIKFLNGINGGSHEWKGDTIHYQSYPADIIRQIECICNTY